MVALGILRKSFFFLKIPNVVNWSDFEETENMHACTKTNKIFFSLHVQKRTVPASFASGAAEGSAASWGEVGGRSAAPCVGVF